MSQKRETLFTIGQFAAIHAINKKTLMWYDEVGLFKPAVIKENGYRYYSYYQSNMLETILMLRELNMSIKEIQIFMNHRSADSLEKLLREKIMELDQKILNLQSVRKLLSTHRNEMSSLMNMDISQISIIEKEQCYLAQVPTTIDTPFEKEIEMVIAEARKHQLHRLHDSTYGSMISVESLYSGNFDNYTALFIEIPMPIQTKGLHVQPKGKYLKAFHKGSWEGLCDKYKVLLDYAKKNNLTLLGYAYEKGINEIVVDTIDDYITQIEIPIRTD